jgi:hypothetical protein
MACSKCSNFFILEVIAQRSRPGSSDPLWYRRSSAVRWEVESAILFGTYILVHSLQWPVIPIIGNGSDDLPIGTYAYLIGPVGVCFAAAGNGWYCVRLHEPAEPL